MSSANFFRFGEVKWNEFGFDNRSVFCLAVLSNVVPDCRHFAQVVRRLELGVFIDLLLGDIQVFGVLNINSLIVKRPLSLEGIKVYFGLLRVVLCLGRLVIFRWVTYWNFITLKIQFDLVKKCIVFSFGSLFSSDKS